MSKETDRSVKHCVYCGSRVYENLVYCDNCGKLIVQIKSEKEKPRLEKSITVSAKRDLSRKCPGCGSIITSTVLNQCPICNEILEEIPQHILKTQKKSKTSGYVFTNKKLEPEQNYVIKKDSWNFKEGMSVFFNCLMIYITVQLLIFMVLWIQVDPNSQINIELNIFTIIISQIPGIAFALYAIGYIVANKHRAKKLGFNSNRDKILKAGILGVVGGFLLLLVTDLSYYINQILDSLGLAFINLAEYNAEEDAIISQAHPIMILLLGIVLCSSAIASEVVIRGVLHNTLKNKFENNIQGKLIIITITSLTYGLIFLLISFGVGITFFIMNFLIGFILGILYEINGNILNTLAAGCVYNILILLIIVFL